MKNSILVAMSLGFTMCALPASAAGPGVVIFEMTGNQELLEAGQKVPPFGQYIFDIRTDTSVDIDLYYEYEYSESWFIRGPGGTITDCYGDDQSRQGGAYVVGERLRHQFIIPKARIELNRDGDCPVGPGETLYSSISYNDLVWRARFDPLVPDQQFTYSINVQHVANPVPEPTTWALMITGFGAAGGALRRRSRSAPEAVA